VITELREFRRANSTLFTVQACLASLFVAFCGAFFSGFTLLFLGVLSVFAAPPIITHKLHEQAWAKLRPIVEPQILLARQKLGVYVPALAPKTSTASTGAAETKKSK
jgi:hypothetical protein